MKLICAILFTLCLTACKCEQCNKTDAENCKPVLVATTPNGMKLYKISTWCSKVHDGHDVYFSEKGTSTRVSSGKTSRPEETPNE